MVGSLCPVLTTFLEDEERSVRLSTAKLFVAVSETDAASVEPVVGALADRLADDEEFYYVRARCAEALGYVALDHPEAVASPEVLADLRIGLSFDEAEVKEKLAAARDVLAARLTDENAYIRGRAAEALGLLARPEATDSMRPESELVTVADEAEAFAAERARFALEATREGDASADLSDRIGTVEAIHGTTQKIVDDITASDADGECPHCGLALPENGPPMCPRCGVSY